MGRPLGSKNKPKEVENGSTSMPESTAKVSKPEPNKPVNTVSKSVKKAVNVNNVENCSECGHRMNFHTGGNGLCGCGCIEYQ